MESLYHFPRDCGSQLGCFDNVIHLVLRLRRSCLSSVSVDSPRDNPVFSTKIVEKSKIIILLTRRFCKKNVLYGNDRKRGGDGGSGGGGDSGITVE